LWINLITDCFPALALGVEKSEKDIMTRAPRNPKSGIFADGIGFNIAYQGIIVSIITLISYFIGHYIESGMWCIARSHDGITMAFLTMSMAEIFHSYNMRSIDKSIFKLKTHNWFLFGAMVVSLILTTLVITVEPIANAFKFTTISVLEYFIALALAFLVIPIVEFVKWIQRKNN
jgi:Ca2+-transporting ATPase